jgi:uncharacterized Zn finger protein
MSSKPGDVHFVAPETLTGTRAEWHDGAVEHKARRLLTTGRVRITEARDGYVSAQVGGDSAVYAVRFADGTWACSCPSASEGQRCSHRAAVELVTS